MLGPVTATFSAFAPFFEHFKPSRSPYLVTSIFSISALTIFGESEDSIERFKIWAFLVPIYACLFVLFVLSFYYRTSQSSTISPEEISDQFKFSRSLGVSVAVVLLYYVSIQDQNIDPLAWSILYVCIIFYFSTFMLYMIFRNIREENPSNIAIFQVAFMTAGFLIGGTLVGAKVNLSDQDLLYDCHYKVNFNYIDSDSVEQSFGADYDDCNGNQRLESAHSEYGQISNYTASYPQKRLSVKLVTAAYLLVLWFFYQIFWVRRLMSITVISFRIEDPETPR